MRGVERARLPGRGDGEALSQATGGRSRSVARQDPDTAPGERARRLGGLLVPACSVSRLGRAGCLSNAIDRSRPERRSRLCRWRLMGSAAVVAMARYACGSGRSHASPPGHRVLILSISAVDLKAFLSRGSRSVRSLQMHAHASAPALTTAS